MKNKLGQLIIDNVSKIEFINDGNGYKIPLESGQIFIHQSDLDKTNLTVYLDQGGEFKTQYYFNYQDSNELKPVLGYWTTSVRNNEGLVEEFLKVESIAKEARLTREFIQLLDDKIVAGERVLYTTNKDDFNKELQSPLGLSHLDLINSKLNGYTYLLSKFGRNLVVVPVSLTNRELRFEIR
jgi:hypothetical protein